ncbi:hypothetical protein [Mycobacteroides abscessus]|uniref:hypothetical protein n=1 Tax=Mycobacteroides abscessus TaxID=36809 RepID=UPI000927B8D3|nr:hypothetical protein [Mycobacteroides abscessus]SIJ95037.1 Uncharacterised protein [Mycobacteroides abscessus subsp. abscessus]
MRYDPDTRTLELTARNITALRDKLADPESARALGSPCGRIMVRAVEDAGRNSTDTSEGMVVVTRSELVRLAGGETVTVGDTAVVPVPDSKHYSTRPAGDVVMPSSGEVRDGLMAMSLRHICEVCGRDEILTPAEGYAQGWDYPPCMGQFGIVGPRTCGSCPMSETVWAALTLNGVAADDLNDAQKDVVARILAEPRSIMVEGSSGD